MLLLSVIRLGQRRDWARAEQEREREWESGDQLPMVTINASQCAAHSSLSITHDDDAGSDVDCDAYKQKEKAMTVKFNALRGRCHGPQRAEQS